MIYMITGKVGAGKTLLALWQILLILARGGCVVTNIALDPVGVDAWLRKHKGARLYEGQIRYYDFEKQPDFRVGVPRGTEKGNVHVFVDEAQLYYNSANDRDMKGTLLDLISYLTQSRKMCVDVTFITQHEDTIWRQFRIQCLLGFKCRDMRQMSFPIIGKIGAMGLRWVSYDVMSGEVLEHGNTKLRKDLFACYDTRQMYDSKMRDIHKGAEIWHPVNKKTGKLHNALICNTCGSDRNRCVCSVENRKLFFPRSHQAENGGEQATRKTPGGYLHSFLHWWFGGFASTRSKRPGEGHDSVPGD